MKKDYLTKRVIGPTEGTDYCGGVGTPFIVNHPYTDENYFLFTGWKTYGGGEREVFVAQIDKDLNLSNIRKILSWDFPGDLTSAGHLAVHATWDEHNKRWIVLTSEDQRLEEGRIRRMGVYRFNDDFSELISYGSVIPPYDSQPSPSGQKLPISDCGVPFLKGIYEKGTEGCFFYATSWPLDGLLAIMHTPDYTAEEVSIDYNDYVFWGGSPAVLQPIQISPEMIVVLVEDLWNQNQWTVKPIFLCGSTHYPTCKLMYGVEAYGSIIPTFSTGTYHIGHPHITVYPDGRFYNFFHTIFRECTPSYRHEIWCTKITPQRLDPVSYSAFFTRLYEGAVENEGYLSKVIPCWFSKQLNVLIENEVEGNLTILEGNEFDNVETVGAAQEVTNGRNVYKHSNPLPYVRISFTPATSGKKVKLSVSLKK